MIKIEHTEVHGWEPAIRGMRNPKNSWSLIDSEGDTIGPRDADLMKRLRDGGPVHRKFMRMITVYVDITAPMYWWAEADTYKVGTVRNSCSKMHKMMAKRFDESDFSFDHVTPGWRQAAESTINRLNLLRDIYFRTPGALEKKQVWYTVLQLLPNSYNQKSTLMLNYEVLAHMYRWRHDHKLQEWRDFCRWVESLPNSWLITGAEAEHG